MKSVTIFILGLMALVTTAQAEIVFIVGPRAGVTINRLSQQEVYLLARATVDSYSLKVSRADAEYRRALENAGIDPRIDTSGELLNEVVNAAMMKREEAYRSAIPSAAKETVGNCARLCYVEVDGRTYQ
jgi:hypothetical protein